MSRLFAWGIGNIRPSLCVRARRLALLCGQSPDQCRAAVSLYRFGLLVADRQLWTVSLSAHASHCHLACDCGAACRLKAELRRGTCRSLPLALLDSLTRGPITSLERTATDLRRAHAPLRRRPCAMIGLGAGLSSDARADRITREHSRGPMAATRQFDAGLVPPKSEPPYSLARRAGPHSRAQTRTGGCDASTRHLVVDCGCAMTGLRAAGLSPDARHLVAGPVSCH
jgi:hypothetical protein